MPKYENANSYWLTEHSKGKAVVDVGCMWGVTGDYSFLAEQSGASRVIGVDIYPAMPAFLEKKSTRNSRVTFVQGDINDPNTTAAIRGELQDDKRNPDGLADIVFCSGVLYHVPDPVYTVRQLGSLLQEDGQLILNTMTIPEQAIPCSAVLLSGLDAGALARLAMGRQGVGLTSTFEPDKGYANWVWGMSASCVREILRISGFVVADEDVGVNQEVFAALCNRRADLEFKNSSGAWSATQGAKVFLAKT